MRGLSPEHLVRVWERGVGLHPTDRALSMLRAADPETEWAVLCDLPIGERDRRLLELREQTFGRELNGVTSCTRCGSRVELRFSVADVSSDPSGQQEHIPLAIPGI